MPVEPDRFLDLVATMRTWQKEYFRTRSPSALEKSKAAERRVDEAIREARQPQLFTD